MAKDSSKPGPLDSTELTRIESEYAQGMTAVQIVEVFASRGVKFSEASFRKYVQQGLLPRSRRVGRKGKHRGSLGVYPAKTVRRIHMIKRLMGEGHTIEEIQDRFLRFTDRLESLEEGLNELLAELSAATSSFADRDREAKSFVRDVAAARTAATDLLRRVNELSERASSTSADMYRGAGAADSTEDLL